MTLWIGVSSNILSIEAGKKSWWCLPERASPGDVLFFYQKLIGIVGLATIISQPDPTDSRCSYYRLATVSIKYLTGTLVPITFKQMKADRTLRLAGAIKRRFQGTSFQVDMIHASRILFFLGKKNPALKLKALINIVKRASSILPKEIQKKRFLGQRKERDRINSGCLVKDFSPDLLSEDSNEDFDAGQSFV